MTWVRSGDGSFFSPPACPPVLPYSATTARPKSFAAHAKPTKLRRPGTRQTSSLLASHQASSPLLSPQPKALGLIRPPQPSPPWTRTVSAERTPPKGRLCASSPSVRSQARVQLIMSPRR